MQPDDLRAVWDFEDPATSEQRFRELADASADPADRERALTQVARALGLQGRYEAGYAVLDSLTGDDVEVAARRELERGRLRRSSGDAHSARPHLEAAARIAGEAGLEELHVDALHMIALVVQTPQRVAATRHALAVARAAVDPGARAWEGSLLNNLGMAYADLDDFRAALATFEEALVARQRAGDASAVRVARWMIAWALRNLGDTSRALELQLALKAELDAAGASDQYVEEELALLRDPDPAPLPNHA